VTTATTEYFVNTTTLGATTIATTKAPTKTLTK
jgi:hypothetical protein